MRKILRITAPVALAVAVLGACGADTTQVSAKRPAVIRVGAGAVETAAAGGVANAAAADSKMAVWRPTKFLLADGLQAPLGPRRAWTFPPAGAQPTEEQKALLAKVFGLSGEWQQASKDFGGYLSLGDSSKGEASVTVNPDAMQSWWYSAPWNTSPVTGCAEPGVAGVTVETGTATAAGTTETVVAGSDGSVAEDPTPTVVAVTETTSAPDTPLPVDCLPQPPKNVPSKAEAEAKAKQLFAQLGLDPAKYVLESYSDEWGAYVTGWLVLDDVKTQLAIGVGFGAEGVITGANGFFAEPVPADEYDLVSLEQAVERMNNPGNGYWGGYYGGVGIMARGGVDVAVAVPANEAGDVVLVPDTANAANRAGCLCGPTPKPQQGATGAAGTATSGTATSDSGTSSDPGLTPEAVPTETVLPLEPVEVTLTGVTMGLQQLWDANGNVWLIPSYNFTDASGGQYSVYAIGDEFLDFSAINGTTDTLPVDTVPVDGVETTAVATPATDAPAPVDPAEPPTTVPMG